MIIFLDASGNIVVPASPEPIGRNSNDASLIYIVSPLPESAQIYLTFTLPNGVPLFGNLADPTGDVIEEDMRQAASYLFSVSSLSAWRYKVPGAVTQYAGTVHYTVCTVMESSMRATASGTFTVSRGNKIIVPSDPTPDQWKTVLAAIGQEKEDSIDVWVAMFGAEGTPDAPKDGSLAAKLIAAQEDCLGVREEIYGEGGTLSAPKDGSLAAKLIAAQEDCLGVREEIYGEGGTLDAPKDGSLAGNVKKIGEKTEGLIRQMGEIPGWSEDADAATLVLRDTNGFVRTATHPDSESFETAPNDDSVSLGDVRQFLPCDFELHMDEKSYVLSFTVKNMEGKELFSGNVDLPLEAVWTAAEYDAETRSIVLTTRDGNRVPVDVSAIVGGLASEKFVEDGFVQKSNKGWCLYGTDGTNDENGLKGTRMVYTSCLGTVASTAVVYQPATNIAQFPDDNNPICTIAVADPVKWFHVANKRYVDKKARELEGGIYNALGAVYVTVENTSLYPTVEFTAATLPWVYIDSLGEVVFYAEDGSSMVTVDTKITEILAFGDEEKTFANPVSGMYIELPTNCSSLMYNFTLSSSPPEGMLIGINGKKIVYQNKGR